MQAHEGLEDALKHVQLEKRTVDSILDLIQRNGWTDDVDLTQNGNIHLIRSQEERTVIETNLKAAQDAGVDISSFDFLSEEECTKVSHRLSLSYMTTKSLNSPDREMAQLIGSKGHLSGLKLPGNNLYPLKFVTKLFELARQEAADIGVDVQLYTHTPVVAVHSHASDSWEAQTSRGSISARAVVHATNAYASHLIPSLLKTEKPVVPCRAQVMAIRPQDDREFWSTGFCELLRGSLHNACIDKAWQRTTKALSTSSKDLIPRQTAKELFLTSYLVAAEA